MQEGRDTNSKGIKAGRRGKRVEGKGGRAGVYLRDRVARVALAGASSGTSSLTAAAALRGALALGTTAAVTAAALDVVARARVVFGTGTEFCEREMGGASASGILGRQRR